MLAWWAFTPAFGGLRLLTWLIHIDAAGACGLVERSARWRTWMGLAYGIGPAHPHHHGFRYRQHTRLAGHPPHPRTSGPRATNSTAAESTTANRAATGQAHTLLEDLADGGTGLLQAASLLIGGLFQRYGLAEAPQLTRDGTINPPAWADQERTRITTCAKHANITRHPHPEPAKNIKTTPPAAPLRNRSAGPQPKATHHHNNRRPVTHRWLGGYGT